MWVKYGDGTRLQAVESWGTYDGAYFLYSTGPYSFEIESSGKWTYRITRLENTDETSFKGTGSAVTDIFTAPSGEWRFRHTSNGDFKVWIYTNKGRELLVNERGDWYIDTFIDLDNDLNWKKEMEDYLKES